MPTRKKRLEPVPATPPARRALPGAHLPLPAVLVGLGLMASQPAAAQAGVAIDDQYSTPFNTTLTGVNVTSNDSLVGNATVQVFTTIAPQHGNLLMQPNGAFTYTPLSGFEGVDQFQYDLINLGNSFAEVTITVGAHDVPALGGAAIAALSAGIAGLAIRRRRKR